MFSLKRLKRHKWFAIFVVFPIFISIIYYGFIASDIYVSESRFVIKSPDQKQAQLSTLANLIQTTGLSAGQEQTNEVLDYLRSRNALSDLLKRYDVKSAYVLEIIDYWSRFPQPFHSDHFENLYKFYKSKIDARLDSESGMAVLSVQAFRADDAQAINAGLLELSEQLVNRLNARAQRRAISEAERRVQGAEERLRRARVAIRGFRNEEAVLDPAKQAVGVIDVSNKLVLEQAGLRAKLELMERSTPANPGIPEMRRRIAAIGQQIDLQYGKAVGTTSGIASKLGGYENLEVEQEFATQALTAAHAALEQARTEAQKQQFYLERVVEPNKPDLPLLPNRIKLILTIAGVAVCLYFVGWMLIVGILEHSPED